MVMRRLNQRLHILELSSLDVCLTPACAKGFCQAFRHELLESHLV